MSAARALDLLTALIAAALAGALVTAWARPEGVFVALVAAASARLLLRPVRLPSMRPTRVVAAGVIA